MEHSWRRLIAVSLVLAGVLLASGCTGDRVRPSSSLPPLPSTSVTPSPTVDAPGAEGFPLPEEARAYTQEGAYAFFNYFIAVLNESSAVNDPEPLREITRGCEFCDELTERFGQNAAEGIRVVGGDFVVTEVAPVTLRRLDSGADGAGFVFRLTQQPAQALDASGNLIQDLPELRLEGTVELAWVPDRRDWLVAFFGVETR